MTMMRIIDADAHMLEPPALWTAGLERRFRDRAPHIEKDSSGRKGSFLVCEDYRHCVSKFHFLPFAKPEVTI